MLVHTRTIFGGLTGVAIIVMAGCGGGGGSSDPAAPPENIDNVTFSGTAAKGIINLGNVVAEELDTSGTVIAQVGSAITGIDGSYSLPVDNSYTGGPVRVTISADENTQMKCDVPAGCGARTDDIADSNNAAVIDFGEWYKPGTGNLTMTALIAEAATGDSIGVNITPYTHLAASRAMEAGSLSTDGIYDANSEVSNLLGGIDILNTRPLDITDSSAMSGDAATGIAYAAFSAAIAALADTSGGNPDINGALAVLLNSFTGGTIPADDGGMDDTIISLQEIIDGATSTLAQTGTTDVSGVFTDLQADVADASGGFVDPQPAPNTGGTALAKVKAFVNDVRTWGTVIEEETSAKGEAFGTQVELASTAADLSMELVTGPALGSAIDAVFMHITGTSATDLSDYEVGLPGNPQFTAGTITYSNGVATITNGLIDGVTINMSVQLPADGSTVTPDLTVDVISATLTSDSSELTINGGAVVISLATPYLIDYEAIDMGTATEPDISGASVSLDVALMQKKDESGAMLVSPVTFAGTLSTTLVNPVEDDTTGETTWITPATLTLTGNISDTTGNSLDASFMANISNADTFEPVGRLDVNTVRDDLVSWTYTGNTFTLVSPEITLTIQWNPDTGTATINEIPGHGYSNRYVATGTYTDIVDAVTRSSSARLNMYSAYGLYVWVDGEGGYYADLGTADFSTDGTASGSLFDPDFMLEDAGNWLEGTVGLTFTLQLAGLPEASVNISGERTEFEAGTATITVAYDNRRIVITGAFSDVSSTGSMTITNQDGVVMVIDGDFETSTGDIKYNGQSYGSITQMSNGLTKITYIDGSFETL